MKNKRLIEVRNLTFSYHWENKKVLKSVNLNLEKGFFYGVVGRNSVGKSTLLKLLAGHLRGFEGSICMEGCTEEAGYKERIATIISDESFFTELSLEDNGVLLGRFYEKFDEELFFEYLERYQLNRKAWLKSHSDGEIMKFCIAFTLACQPEILILDEPAGVLDADARKELMHLLSYLATEKQITIVMATHLTEDLDQLADFVIFVNENGTVATYDKETLCDKYAILKGTKEQIEQLDCVVASEITEVTATAMTNRYDEMKEQVEEIGLRKEIATLEDIMYYNDLGKCVMEDKQDGTTEILPVVQKQDMRRYGKLRSMYRQLMGVQGRSINAIIMWMAVFVFCAVSYIDSYGNMKVFSLLTAVVSGILFAVAETPKKITEDELCGVLRRIPISNSEYIRFRIARCSVGLGWQFLGVLLSGLLVWIGRDCWRPTEMAVIMLVSILIWLSEIIRVFYQSRYK